MTGFQTKDNNKLCRVGLGRFLSMGHSAIRILLSSPSRFFFLFSIFSNKKQKRELSNDKKSQVIFLALLHLLLQLNLQIAKPALFLGKWVKLMLLLKIYAKHYVAQSSPIRSLIACWSTLRIITPTSCTVGIECSILVDPEAVNRDVHSWLKLSPHSTPTHSVNFTGMRGNRLNEWKDGSFYVSVKLPTYPSAKPTLTLSSYLRQNVGLGEG